METPFTHALLTGSFEGLPEETAFLYARMGLVPLFAASGFHLWAAKRAADALSLPFRRVLPEGRPRLIAAFAIRLLLTLLVASLAGWSSPMVRAFLLITLSGSARLLEVRASRGWIFLVALTASAVLGKGSISSFLFSMAGLAGAYFFRPRNRWLAPLGPWLATLPLTVFCFSLFPLLAPFWNLTVGVLIGGAVLPLAVISLLIPDVAPLPEWLMEKITTFLFHAPDFAFWVRPFPWAFLAIALLFAAWRRGRTGMAIAVLASALAWLAPLPSIAALDVGQGDSIFVRTSEPLLEDAGPPGFHGYPAAASHSLESLGVGRLGDILLSHFDLDHRGGLDTVLARHSVMGALWFREVDLEAKRHEKVLAAAERARVPIRFLTNTASPPGIQCWLAPFSGNDSSPLCRAQLAGGGTALLTGDMEARTEEWLVANVRPFPTADILKVAHHGSKGSSTDEFLAATGTHTALISVGAKNRYHHPSPETLDRLAHAGIKARRTDQGGTLGEYYFSPFTLESIRPVFTLISRVYPGNPATAR
jgi:competence protein ComEC